MGEKTKGEIWRENVKKFILTLGIIGAILFFAMRYLVFIFFEKESKKLSPSDFKRIEAERKQDKANDLVKNTVYVKDPRTGICYSIYAADIII